jgi:hypothetical protein
MKVKFNLKQVDSNAFAILGGWEAAARKQKVSDEEIAKVLEDATANDYQHLVATILKHSKK